MYRQPQVNKIYICVCVCVYKYIYIYEYMHIYQNAHTILTSTVRCTYSVKYGLLLLCILTASHTFNCFLLLPKNNVCIMYCFFAEVLFCYRSTNCFCGQDFKKHFPTRLFFFLVYPESFIYIVSSLPHLKNPGLSL